MAEESCAMAKQCESDLLAIEWQKIPEPIMMLTHEVHDSIG